MQALSSCLLAEWVHYIPSNIIQVLALSSIKFIRFHLTSFPHFQMVMDVKGDNQAIIFNLAPFYRPSLSSISNIVLELLDQPQSSLQTITFWKENEMTHVCLTRSQTYSFVHPVSILILLLICSHQAHHASICFNPNIIQPKICLMKPYFCFF